MRIARKWLKPLGIALALVGLLVVAVRAWVVPALVVRALEARAGGRVEIRDWWLNTRSAGVVGLKVAEGLEAHAPVWATAERVATDLSLGGLLRGRLAPGEIRLDRPRVSLRFDRKGALLTKVGSGAGPSGPIPRIIASGAKVTLQQEGRPSMVVSGVTARLAPDANKLSLAAHADDPEWGLCEVHGAFDPAFRSGQIALKSTAPIYLDTAKADTIPFIPDGVWTNVVPDGKVDLNLIVEIGTDKPGSIGVRTKLSLHDATVTSSALELTATHANGRVVVDGALVRLEKVAGRAVDGRVTADGVMDFRGEIPRFALSLDLDHINVADAPRSWQLEESGVTGRLTGKVQLLALLKEQGVDLSGTTGEAIVEGGELQGLPFKRMKLVVEGSGRELRYGRSGPPSSSSSSQREQVRILGVCALSPPWHLHPVAHLLQAWAALAAEEVVALQVPEEQPAREEPAKPGVQLPRALTTEIEIEDVDITKIIARAEFLLGYPFPVPVSGILSVKAVATIPLGKLQSVKDYAFHGDLTLKGAAIDKVDVGHVAAHIDLADGVLALQDFRGRLVDRPNGGPDNPPSAETPEVAATGPLPEGGFRGELRAALSPPGGLWAHLEGNVLPLGELTAPALPRPTPLSGRANLFFEASADLSAAADPRAWTALGTVKSRQIRYQTATLDGLDVNFQLDEGRLELSDLSAQLEGQPLKANLALDLKPPYTFGAAVDVAGWDVAKVLAWLPGGGARPVPMSGAVTARAEGSGTLQPLAVKTKGQGHFDQLAAGPVLLGVVPLAWTTREDAIAVQINEARPLGGLVNAEATVPLAPGKPIEGSATIRAIDLARTSAAIPAGALRMTGKASGNATFSLPSDISALEAFVRLGAPDLTVQGVPAEKVEATIRAKKGTCAYDVKADSLGGAITLAGGFPLTGAMPSEAGGELRAVGFTLERLWKTLGMTGALTRISGRGAIDANLRALLGGDGSGLYAHGLAELRDLKWGNTLALGQLKGILALTPNYWRVDPLAGELFGGEVNGFMWGGEAPGQAGGNQLGFEMQVERASLKGALAFLNVLGPGSSGFGTLRIAGSLGESFRASGDFYVPHGKLAGLPVSGLRLPAELVTTGGQGQAVMSTGTIHLRRFTARVAGGSLRGDAWFRVGEERAFSSTLNLDALDLETIARVYSDAQRPASGKLTGKITLFGPDPALAAKHRGKIVLDLDDGSLVAMPVFREIDKFLGSAGGGLFEDGDLVANIANRQLTVESMTLEGKLAQLHITGSVGYDGMLNLEVLVNTSQLISETGQALARLLGISATGGRRGEATRQFNSFLSARLMKLRVTGTLKNPSVTLDPGISVGESATGFFGGVLKLPTDID
jgi:translocation and assembly module TamB